MWLPFLDESMSGFSDTDTDAPSDSKSSSDSETGPAVTQVSFYI